MSEMTHIQWTGATWNPVQGCHKVSAGCAKCYMFRDKERYGQGPNVVIRSKPATFDKPLKWQREAEKGDRVSDDLRVFTCSWSDWFIEEADPWRDEMWAVIKACPLLTFQILTKRPERMAGHFPADWGPDGYSNCWGGVSVEDQKAADARISHLLKSPWSIRFLSVEPILSPIDLTNGNASGYDWNYLTGEMWSPAHSRRMRGVDWCIVGGESGNKTGKYKARPTDVDWIRSVIEQCKVADATCFVKQLGSAPFHHGSVSGKAVPLDLKDHHGGDIDEWPEDLRVREMPASRAIAPAGGLF
jgi:protein gp37